MDFDYSPKTKDLQERVLRFMDEHIYPAGWRTMPKSPLTRQQANVGRRSKLLKT